MKRALIYIAAAAACVIAGGLLLGVTEHMSAGNGMYCGLGDAATVGCTPGIPVAARIVSVVLILTAVPLFALAYGSLSSAHLRRHMDLHRRAAVAELRHEMDDLRQHTRKTVDGAARSLHRRLDDHESLIRAMAADGPVREGAGGNPAQSAGLSAETGPAADSAAASGSVVPPSAAADPPLGSERLTPPPGRPGGM